MLTKCILSKLGFEPIDTYVFMTTGGVITSVKSHLDSPLEYLLFLANSLALYCTVTVEQEN
jgi:hypothetical protein